MRKINAGIRLGKKRGKRQPPLSGALEDWTKTQWYSLHQENGAKDLTGDETPFHKRWVELSKCATYKTSD